MINVFMFSFILNLNKIQQIYWERSNKLVTTGLKAMRVLTRNYS